MTDLAARRHDVVVVGGRVAGCALGVHLARAGLSVAIVERERVLGDTLSTHTLQDLGLLAELGALDDVLASGAPPLVATRLTVDGIDLSAAHPRHPRLCVRRSWLDGALARAAVAAGATMLTGTSVVGLIRDRERVTGVTIQSAHGGRRDLRAALVVGADGRNSTVARLVGSVKYDIAPNERTGYWRYYAGLPMPAEFHLTRRGRDLALAAPCDHGLTLVAAQPPLDDDRDWRDPALLEAVAGDLIGPLRGVLRNAEPVGEVRAVRRMDGFFREAAGPGWVLVGDAGHFKDVVVGQGICDAMRQARSLARAVGPNLGDGELLDAALRAWWLERDADARPMYWFSQDLGRVETSVLEHEVLRVVSRSPRHRRNFHEVLEHRRPPRHVVGSAVAGQAVATAALRSSISGTDLRAALATALRRERERRNSERRGPIAA
jgi:2-polyprenyl-6-methoxyphenol hydroxylase-like FAD-dependent oxidoreductase